MGAWLRWTEEEHAAFLHHRRQALATGQVSTQAVARFLQSRLPGRSPAEIATHETWCAWDEPDQRAREGSRHTTASLQAPGAAAAEHGRALCPGAQAAAVLRVPCARAGAHGRVRPAAGQGLQCAGRARRTRCDARPAAGPAGGDAGGPGAARGRAGSGARGAGAGGRLPAVHGGQRCCRSECRGSVQVRRAEQAAKQEVVASQRSQAKQQISAYRQALLPARMQPHGGAAKLHNLAEEARVQAQQGAGGGGAGCRCCGAGVCCRSPGAARRAGVSASAHGRRQPSDCCACCRRPLRRLSARSASPSGWPG